MTFGGDGSPLWLSALLTPSAPRNYVGDLLRASGPPFGAAFDPSQVNLATVGTAEVAVENSNAIAWRYSIGGLSGDKPLTRFLFSAPAGTICR